MALHQRRRHALVGADRLPTPHGVLLGVVGVLVDREASLPNGDGRGDDPLGVEASHSWEIATSWWPTSALPCSRRSSKNSDHWLSGNIRSISILVASRPTASVGTTNRTGFSDPVFASSVRATTSTFLYDLGYDVLMVSLAFHGRRRGHLQPFSGCEYLVYGHKHTGEANMQAEHDVRTWMNWLFEQGVTKVGMTGFPLGGHTTALVAAAEDRLSFVVPNGPAVHLPSLVQAWTSLGKVATSAPSNGSSAIRTRSPRP